MESEAVSYWCYICDKHFQAGQSVNSCTICKSDAIEIAPNNQPAPFTVYQVVQSPNNSPQIIPSSNLAPQQPMGNPLFQLFSQPLFQIGTASIPPPQSGQNIHMNSVTLNMNNNMNHMFSHFDSMIRTGGIQMLLQSLMGENHLVPANTQEITKLQKVEKVVECPICQEQGSEKDERKGFKLKCGHVFHMDCLTPWLDRTNTCPSCRQRI